MFLFRGTGVFHFTEHGAGEFGAVAAVSVFTLIYGTVIQRAGFCGHHFQRPEGLALYGVAAGTLFFKEIAIGTNKSAGRKGHNAGCWLSHKVMGKKTISMNAPVIFHVFHHLVLKIL